MKETTKTCIVWALVSALAIFLGISLANYIYNPCDESVLRESAPETLIKPDIKGFTDYYHYMRAVGLYEKYGTWAALDDGTVCRIK